MMLFALPSDLSISILREWLGDIKSITSLDIAAAKSVRAEWLDLVAHPTFILISPLVLDTGTNWVDVVLWVNTRMIKLNDLAVAVGNLPFCLKIRYASLATVSRMAMRSNPEANEISDVGIFKRLLTLLPSLTAIGLFGFIPTDSSYLAVLASSGLPLKHVELDNTLETCDNVHLLITAICKSVQGLMLGDRRQVDVDLLHHISTCCHEIERIHFVCNGVNEQTIISCFGSQSLPLLQGLVIDDISGSATLSDDAARAIFQHHPMLVYLMAVKSTASLEVCTDAFTCCPELVRLVTAAYELIVDDDEQYCKISFNNGILVNDAMSFGEELARISSSKYPIKQLLTDPVIFADDDLLSAVSGVGSYLSILTWTLNNSPNDDNIVQQVSLLCPGLETVKIFDCESLSDLAARMIADNFRSLSSLHLAGATMITDFGYCYLLFKLGERLRSLCFWHCPGLTDAILLPLLTACTQLTTLGVRNCGITSIALRDQLIIPNRLPLLRELQVDATAFNTLHAYVANANNGADGRWAKMLAVDAHKID